MHRKYAAVTITALAAAGLLSGCSGIATALASPSPTAPSAPTPAATIGQGLSRDFSYEDVPLPDGYTLRCVTWASKFENKGGLSCDWDHLTKTDKG